MSVQSSVSMYVHVCMRRVCMRVHACVRLCVHTCVHGYVSACVCVRMNAFTPKW